MLQDQADIQQLALYPTALASAQPPHILTSSVGTLLATSHSIEETVIQHQLPGVFFAGFQYLSAFLPQAKRFRRLAANCQRVYVFAYPDVPGPEIPNLEYVALNSDAPLINEWFIVFVHAQFSVALLTQQVSQHSGRLSSYRYDGERLYDGLLSFDEEVVRASAQQLAQALDTSSSAKNDLLPNGHPLSTFVQQFSHYMENAQSRLAALYRDLGERTFALEQQEKIVRTLLSRQAWESSIELADSAAPDDLPPTRQQLTILITDIEGFTPLFEHHDPLALTRLLNRYFNSLTTTIYEHHGDVDKLLGDGILAFFAHPQQALAAAVDIQKRLQRFNQQHAAQLGLTLNTRIGISSGECIIARLGSAVRREVTLIGDPVNTASRLQGQSPRNGAAIDEATRQMVGLNSSTHTQVTLKGKGVQQIYTFSHETLIALELS